MPQPNMKKEYRSELRILRSNRRHALGDWKSFARATKKVIKGIEREVNGAELRTRSTLARLDKRIAIVSGRLG